MNRALITAAFTACAAALAAGCAIGPAAPAPVAALTGEPWNIIAIDGVPVVAGSTPTIAFDQDGRAFGGSGCNRYNASYQAGADGRLSFGRAVSTRMACQPPLMEQERRLFQALEAVTGYALGADGVLVLYGGDGPRLQARR